MCLCHPPHPPPCMPACASSYNQRQSWVFFFPTFYGTTPSLWLQAGGSSEQISHEHWHLSRTCLFWDLKPARLEVPSDCVCVNACFIPFPFPGHVYSVFNPRLGFPIFHFYYVNSTATFSETGGRIEVFTQCTILTWESWFMFLEDLPACYVQIRLQWLGLHAGKCVRRCFR